MYATLRYEGEERRRLRAAAPGHVAYVDSLSKTVGGGLRLGWIAAPVFRHRAADVLLVGALAQVTRADLLDERRRRHVRVDLEAREAPEQRSARRRDALCDALERHLGEEASWLRPRGGHHVWVTLRRPVDERTLYLEALHSGVSYTQGSAATVEPPARTSMRLSFGLLTPAQLDEAVRRFAVALRAAHRTQRTSASFPIS